jgi:hypothetical protein
MHHTSSSWSGTLRSHPLCDYLTSFITVICVTISGSGGVAVGPLSVPVSLLFYVWKEHTLMQTLSVLNLLAITSVINTVTMFLIVDSQTKLHTEYVGVFVVWLHTLFHVCVSSGLLVITVKLWAKENIYTAILLLLYNLQKNASSWVAYFQSFITRKYFVILYYMESEKMCIFLVIIDCRKF